jgi:hypothetical protein
MITPAWATTAGPVLSIAGPNSITLHHASNPRGTSRSWTGSTVLLVEDDGPSIAKYQIISFKDSPVGSTPHLDKNESMPIIRGYGITELPVTLTLADNWSTSLTLSLVVAKPAQIKPATITLTLLRSPRTSDYLIPIIFAGLFSILIMLWTLYSLEPLSATRPVYTASSWGFSSSWLTALSALGAIFGTVLAATGFLADVFPGVDVQRFFSLNVLFASAILAAPLVYAAASKSDPHGRVTIGSVGGFTLASAVTLFGVTGEVATLAVLVWIADTGKGAQASLTVTLILIVLIIAWYAHTTTRQIIQLPPPEQREGTDKESPITRSPIL